MAKNHGGQLIEAPSAEWPFDADALSARPAFSADRLLKAIVREWRVFMLGFLAVLTLGGLYFALAPRQYTATTIVMAAPRQEDLARTDTVAGMNSGRPQEVIPVDIEGEMQLMSAPSLLKRVSRDLDLDTPAFVGDGVSMSGLVAQLLAWAGLQTEPAVADVAPAERLSIQAAERLAKKLSVSSIGRSTMVEIGFTAGSPQLAAAVANAVAQNYIRARFQARVATAEQAAAYLHQRTTELQLDSIKADRAVANYKAQATIQNQDLTQAKAGLNTLNDRLLAARANQELVASKLAVAEEQVKLEGPGAMLAWDSVPGSEQYLAQQRAIAELHRDSARLAVTTGAYNAQANRIDAIAANLERQLDGDGMAKLNGFRMNAAAAARDVAALEQMVGDQRAKVDRLESRQVELNVLERNAASSQSVFDNFVNRSKATDQVGFNEAQGWIVSAASVPLRHSKPNGLVIALASLIAATGIGLSLALLRDYRGGQTLRGLEDIDLHLRERFLGLLPKRDKRSRGPLRQVQAILSRADPVFYEAAEALYACLDSAAEQDFTAAPGSRIVMVTSSLPQEGKTTMASVLAAVASASGKRVLIVDCDLRSPAMGQAFMARSGPSANLVSWLQDGADGTGAIFRHADSGIWVLPAGKAVRAPQHLLGSPGMAALLAALRPRFDLILLDAPPVLPFSDARILARLADHTVLAARWAQTRWQPAKLALRQLHEAGAALAGVVLTCVDMKRFAAFGTAEGEAFRRQYQSHYLRVSPPGPEPLARLPH